MPYWTGYSRCLLYSIIHVLRVFIWQFFQGGRGGGGGGEEEKYKFSVSHMQTLTFSQVHLKCLFICTCTFFCVIFAEVSVVFVCEVGGDVSLMPLL